MLQWRNMARVAARQMDAGNATTLHLLDRYWSSLGRPDQNFGGHMTKAFNVWLTQLLMNAYHTIAEERGLLANPVLLAQPSRSYRRDEVQCVLLPGRPGAQGRKVRCAKYPLRVDFEKGCAIERETDDPLVGHAEIMWARNCTPEVFL